MRILMTNLRLTWYSGSDTYLYTLGKELMNRGHKISIYAPAISHILQGRRFEEAGFKIITDLKVEFDKVNKGMDFDVIHGHHNMILSEVHSIFTKLPAIFVSHGVLPEPEKYPRDVLISKYIAVSEEVLEYQFKDIDKSRKKIIRNPIDTDRFYYAPKKVGKKIKILIASNYYNNEWSAKEVWDTAKELNAEIDVIGTNGKVTFETEKIIKDCDIAIGLGRSILEAMSMGKPVIVGDYNGYDGLITPESYLNIRKSNFSGRCYKEKWDKEKLTSVIKDIFSSDCLKMGKNNRNIILKNHNIKKIADEFEQIYKKIKV